MARRFDAVEFVARHGVVLASAKGPVPSLAEAVVGAPIRGSWWSHPRGGEIFRALGAVSESPDVRCFRLVDRKITFVHRRLWGALVRLSKELGRERLTVISQRHTDSGAHENELTPFPRWVTPDVAAEARGMSSDEARTRLGAWLAAKRRATKSVKGAAAAREKHNPGSGIKGAAAAREKHNPGSAIAGAGPVRKKQKPAGRATAAVPGIRTFRVTLGSDAGNLFFEVPFDVKAVFGAARPRITVALEGHRYRSTISVYGGKFYVPVRRDHREAAGVSVGDRVEVTLAPDTEPRIVVPPPELAVALQKNAKARAAWERLSFTHQKEHADAIADARKPETRERRIAKALEMLGRKGG